MSATINPTSNTYPYVSLIDLRVGLGQWPTSVQGLLANAGVASSWNSNANPLSVESSGGDVLTAPFDFKDFYGLYTNSWRVPSEQSLLNVCGGKASIGVPKQVFYASNLGASAEAAAQATCSAAGVTVATLLNDCTLDVAELGEGAVAAYAEIPSPVAWGQILPASGVISLNAKKGMAGSVVGSSLNGFDANSLVTLNWGSASGPTLGTVTTNSAGSATGTFTVPPVADGTYELYAQDSDGASAEATYVVTGKAPVVRGVSPDYGAADTTVTITGANLGGALAVDFGSSPALSFVASATSVTAVAPPGEGLVPVTVTTPVGVSAVSAKDDFDYAPTVTGIAPKKGTVDGGTAVTITGTNFTNATAVDFGLSPAPSFTVISATQIAATSPGGTGTADVTVTSSGGTSPIGSKDQFTYTGSGAPTITSVASATFTDSTTNSFKVTTASYPVSTITETGSLPSGVSFVDNGNGTATLWELQPQAQRRAIRSPSPRPTG